MSGGLYTHAQLAVLTHHYNAVTKGNLLGVVSIPTSLTSCQRQQVVNCMGFVAAHSGQHWFKPAPTACGIRCVADEIVLGKSKWVGLYFK